MTESMKGKIFACLSAALALTLWCMADSALAQTYFERQGDRVEGRTSDGNMTVIVDMAVPEQPQTLPFFQVRNADFNVKKMMQALNGHVYEELGELQWQTSYEKNSEEASYTYFELHGQGGMYLTKMAVDCLPFRNTQDPNAAKAEEILLSVLQDLDISFQYPFYFVGRVEDVLERFYTHENATSEREKQNGGILGGPVEDLATFIVARYPLEAYTVAPKYFILRPNQKTVNPSEYKYDRGGYIAAAIDDEGKIIHIEFINPIQSMKRKEETVACISWEEVLEKKISQMLANKSDQWIKAQNTIRGMEICYALDEKGRAYPLWQILEEGEQTVYVPGTTKIMEHTYIWRICIDAAPQ